MKNIDIKQKMDLDDPVNQIVYSQMIKVPIYKNIPLSLRGKEA